MTPIKLDFILFCCEALKLAKFFFHTFFNLFNYHSFVIKLFVNQFHLLNLAKKKASELGLPILYQ